MFSSIWTRKPKNVFLIISRYAELDERNSLKSIKKIVPRPGPDGTGEMKSKKKLDKRGPRAAFGSRSVSAGSDCERI